MNRMNRISDLLDAAVARGTCSAAAVAVTVHGEPVLRYGTGVLQRFDDDCAELPAGRQQPVTPETLFDLASVTKAYSAHTLLGLVASGTLALDAPLADHLPEYREGERPKVTLRHLLTHTSGLPAVWDGWRPAAERRAAPNALASWPPDRRTLLADLAATPLTAPPGTRWEYACTGYLTAMLLAERATGEPWEALVARHTLAPLGLAATTFRPDPARTAATEHQPQFARGTVRGTVHDEASWSLGGTAANAGLFAPLEDVARFAEAIRRGEDERTAAWMWEDQLPDVLPPDAERPPHGASLGLRIGETVWMGAAGRRSRGHTGFTGTSMQIDRERGLTVVLLTNRVHPTRDGGSVHPLRAAVADAATALAPLA
ncbi:serine hydrolase domain-containing protein [Streptacidiphilus fuscans]|uniref:Beta-lactamase family protein n=1 Tax=Streptacidiphilus fuscans TaxID=2789292 RepID=A0A931AWR8_9ACTN|nr:serine hydrolase domain-containing protein [Streptacidiphilus fuscans]MBF9066940.1 beta-lactamase family protein [Streptacidiphilus fuscans]